MFGTGGAGPVRRADGGAQGDRGGPVASSVMAAPPPRRPAPRGGILSGPIDLDGPARPRNEYPTMAARPGLVVKQRGTPITGTVIGLVNGVLQVRDRQGFEHRMALLRGGFEVDGQVVTLVEPRGPAPAGGAAPASGAGAASRVGRTASGSIAVPRAPAQVAKASRILV